MTHRTLPALLIPGLLLLTASDALAKKPTPLSCKSPIAKKAAVNQFALHLKKKKKPYTTKKTWPKPAETLDLTKKKAASNNDTFEQHSSLLVLHPNKAISLYFQALASVSTVYSCTYAFPNGERVPQFKELSLVQSGRPQFVSDASSGGFKIKRRSGKYTATIIFIIPAGPTSLLTDVKARKR